MANKINLADNIKTRTGNEITISYNLTPSLLLGQIAFISPSELEFVPEESCAEDIAFSASGGFLAVRAARANEHTGDIELGVNTSGGNGSVTVEGVQPISYSKEVSGTITTLDLAPDDVTSVSLNSGTGVTGDSYQLFVLPNPAENVLICYDRGFEANLGDTQRAIPRKFRAVDHYVTTRGESSITLNDLLVSNKRGLRRIRGRDVTLVVTLTPGGFGLPVEVQYFTKVRLNVPMSVPEGDDSVQISGTGNFEFDLVFSA